MTFINILNSIYSLRPTPVHVTDNHTTVTGHNERQTLKANKSITNDCMDTTYENWLEK